MSIFCFGKKSNPLQNYERIFIIIILIFTIWINSAYIKGILLMMDLNFHLFYKLSVQATNLYESIKVFKTVTLLQLKYLLLLEVVCVVLVFLFEVASPSSSCLYSSLNVTDFSWCVSKDKQGLLAHAFLFSPLWSYLLPGLFLFLFALKASLHP